MSSLLEQLTSTIEGLASTLGAAVVGVGRGSGVVIAEGQVLTNAHNVRSEQVHVHMGDGRVGDGTLLGHDLDGDLAVIEVGTGDVTPVAWGSWSPGIGSAVFALANPHGRGVRVTFGTVSVVGRGFRGPRGRVIADAIEHTAPAARGSSGGPLVGADGKLVGIDTHRRGDGLYLAIPASTEVRERVQALATGQVRQRARLGVAIAPPRMAAKMREAVGLEPRDGLLVRGVEQDGPARDAGLQRGDLVIEAAGQPVTTPDELFAILEAHDVSTPLALTVVRGTEEHQLEVGFER
ncbi:MAG TPA: S1C family serine protease [Nitriliruptorales bacterium]